MRGPQCGESGLAGAPLHESRRWVYRQGCRQPERQCESAALCPRPRQSLRPDQEPRAPCRVPSQREGLPGSRGFQPPSQPSFSSVGKMALRPSLTGRACSPPPCSTQHPCTPRPRLVLKSGSTMPARAGSSAQPPRALGHLAPCPTRGSPPSGAPPARGEVSLSHGRPRGAGCVWGRPCARAPIWCGARPEEVWFCLDGHVALLCPGSAREQEAALALLPCPAGCISGTQGGPVRSSSRPAQAHGPWRLQAVYPSCCWAPAVDRQCSRWLRPVSVRCWLVVLSFETESAVTDRALIFFMTM